MRAANVLCYLAQGLTLGFISDIFLNTSFCILSGRWLIESAWQAALIDAITRKTFVRHQSAPFHDTYERSCKLQDHVLQTTRGSSRAAPRFLKLTSLPVKKPKKTMAHGVKTVNIT